MKFNKKVNTTNLSSSILMYSFLNCYQCIMYIYTHIQCARIKTKIGVRGSFFFRGEGLGLSEAYFGGFYYVNLIKFWIHAYAYTSKLHLRYATVLQVHVIIIVLKMFIYMYLHEHVILLFKGLTVTKLFTFCLSQISWNEISTFEDQLNFHLYQYDKSWIFAAPE